MTHALLQHWMLMQGPETPEEAREQWLASLSAEQMEMFRRAIDESTVQAQLPDPMYFSEVPAAQQISLEEDDLPPIFDCPEFVPYCPVPWQVCTECGKEFPVCGSMTVNRYLHRSASPTGCTSSPSAPSRQAAKTAR